jgi:hypothetical protein
MKFEILGPTIIAETSQKSVTITWDELKNKDSNDQEQVLPAGNKKIEGLSPDTHYVVGLHLNKDKQPPTLDFSVSKCTSMVAVVKTEA